MTAEHLITGFVRSLAIAAICLSPPAYAASANIEDRIERYRDAIATDLPAAAQDALLRIEGTPRQLLALRSYLRANARLIERWSWSDDEIESFEKTDGLPRADGGSRSRADALRGGESGLYALCEHRRAKPRHANRALEYERVGTARRDRDRKAVAKELLASHYADPPSTTSIDRFRIFLQRWRPPGAPALAAPGLSLHGQLRAIDFAVYKDGRVIAPTTLTAADAVWKEDGWSEKLKRATIGTRFIGPLTVPDEPWHYEYTPRTRVASEE